MTLTELQSSKKISLHHKAGWVGQVSSNAAVYTHVYTVKFASDVQGNLVIGNGINRSQDKARAQAWDAALQWVNS